MTQAIRIVLLIGFGRLYGANDLPLGIEAFHRGDYLSARQYLRKALDASPNDARARIFMALTQAASGSCAEATAELRTLAPGAAMLALLAHAPAARLKPRAALTTLKPLVRRARVVRGVRGEARETAAMLLDALVAEDS